jgi:hypothetical protein
MDASLKKILRGISLELRHELEGWHDKKTGVWNPGDLERRLNEIGVWSDRPSKPLDEMPHLSAEDKAARRLVDGYLQLRAEAGVERAAAVAEFVRESAYTWANRLFALRCMEARGIIDEVILQKAAYAGRSLVHQRFLRKNPDAAKGEDDGLYAVLFAEFAVRFQELPALFDPKSPAVALRPSVAAMKRCVALLSGTETVRGQDPATDEVFVAPDAFGWAYQYWNADEKDRVFEMVRTKKGTKIQGADIIPATQLYTEPYMVKFLVQNSLGALWMGMYPDSKLCERWEYYVKDADRAPVTRKPVCEIASLDPAQGSGHFHLEAFDLFYAMYDEEAARESRPLTPREIAAAVLNHNLYGIDIDGRSVQIATAALWMKAKERASDLEAGDLTTFHEHLVATNIRLPKGKDHLEFFLQKHPEDKDLSPALELVFQGLEHADELGALLQIEQLVDAVLRRLKEEADKNKGTAIQAGLFERTLEQGTLPVTVEDYDKWKRDALNRLQSHFETEAQAADSVQAYFGQSVGQGLKVLNLLSRRFDVVTANPPYMGSKNMGDEFKAYVAKQFAYGKRDLYAAFAIRCINFTRPGGRVALVAQHSWMFLKSFAEFRAEAKPTAETNTNRFRGLLLQTSIELLAHLGAGAFHEISGEVVNIALLVCSNNTPRQNHKMTALRLIGSRDPRQKEEGLRSLHLSDNTPNRFTILQGKFLTVPFQPIVYWIADEFFDLLSKGAKLGSIASIRKGLATLNNGRFIKFFWEIPLSTRRWAQLAKAGFNARWAGGSNRLVEWQNDGIRVKENVSRAYDGAHWSKEVRSPELYFSPGLCYSIMSQGSLSVRLLRSEIFENKTGAIFGADHLLPLLNTRPVTYMLRILSSGIEFNTGTLEQLPLPSIAVAFVDAVPLKELLVQRDVVEWSFLLDSSTRKQPGLRRAAVQTILAESALEATIATLEGLNDDAAIVAYSLSNCAQAIQDETGKPSTSYPLIRGYDGSVGISAECCHTKVVLQHLDACLRLDPSQQELASIKAKVQAFLNRRPVSQVNSFEADVEAAPDSDEEEISVGSFLPIPSESAIQTLSQDLAVHPISIYWLLREGVEEEGWHCSSEERRLTEDWFTVLVLRLLGHRWPKQLKGFEALPKWADQDGVIPLIAAGGERPLIERLGERLTEEIPDGNVAALEHEFEEIVGVSLEQWLTGPFFERHISQFKKRPIAWQLETVVGRQMVVPGGKGKKKRGVAGKPVFACLVYYHKMDVDLLPKIRTQYVGLLRGGFETEFRTLELLVNPTGDQQARRLDLEQWTDELQTFDWLLEDVSLRGFGPDALRPALRQNGINDALLSLTSSWLGRLSETVAKGPMSEWVEAAKKTELHPDLPQWLRDSMSNLNRFCAVLGPTPPDEKTLPADPTSKELAPLVYNQAKRMVESSLKLGCARWWKPLDDAVLEALRQESKTAKEEIEKIDEELKSEGLPFQRRNELGERKHELKVKIKSIKSDHDEKSDRARKIRSQIEKWACPEAGTWETWLSVQPLFDAVTSLDGQRPPPQSIADFITQESRYAPDVNDGVRVNIAPIQKAGLLHADVLDAKDADKAIADRAEWRADERRWVREGKLPQPGWWKTNNTEVKP